MAQNIYDDESFLSAYLTLPRSQFGLDAAPEWPALRALLPSLDGRDVVDLGCGLGWFCRWALDAGASSVTGIDLSTRMLERARTASPSPGVRYERQDLEQLALERDAYDLAYSSLALHYLDAIDGFCATVHEALRPGGAFVFSIEHPIFTAPTRPGFVTDAAGATTWPLDAYLAEGPRVTDWLAPGVVKHHRTIGTYHAALHAAGFAVTAIVEWGPSPEQVAAEPAWAAEVERPPFLLVRAERRADDPPPRAR